MDSQTLADCCLNFLNNEKHPDVVFIVGEAKERILSHKFPLMVRSSIFEAMFAERWKNRIEEMEMFDVESSVFRQFLQYMYGDIFTTKIEEAIKILYVAHKYQVTSLVDRCNLLMQKGMQLENVIPIFQSARCYNLPLLKKQAGHMIAKEFSVLITHTSFQLMEEGALIELLSRNDLLVDELKLFHALLRWSQIQLGTETPTPSEQRRVLEKILPLVRFASMKVQDFAMEVIPKCILTSDESVVLFTYMTSEESARSGLRAKLGFPWQPRGPHISEYVVKFYEAHANDLHLKSNFLVPVTDQMDKTEFSFAWSKQSLSSGINNNAYIASIILRGPSYSCVSNSSKKSFRPWTNSWIVSLKLEKLPLQLGSTLDLVEACSSHVSERLFDNLEIFLNKDTVVEINPPFVFQTEFKYRITVSYADSVYLLSPGKVDGADTEDYLTSTRKKDNIVVKNNDGIPELELISIRPNSIASEYNEDCQKLLTSSHCIRSIKLKVHNY